MTLDARQAARRWYKNATFFSGVGIIYVILIAAGAYFVGLGQAETCQATWPTTAIECEIDSATHVAYSIGAFVGGLLMIVPIFAAVQILTGIGDILNAEADKAEAAASAENGLRSTSE